MAIPTLWVLGNWKQNNTRDSARAAAQAIAAGLPEALGQARDDVRVGVAPPYLSLEAVRPFTRPATPVWLLAQDSAAQESGAFTGEVGVAMLQEVGVEATIIGHSERRSYFGETDALAARKVANALEHGLTVVLCVGEPLEVREAGNHESTVVAQLSASLARVPPERIGPNLVLAYEPVWAIGTGRTATPEQARDMHRVLRAWLRETYGEAGADRSILYGGSVKASNAAELIAAGDIDGFLVGGASLDPASFLAIVRAAAAPVRP